MLTNKQKAFLRKLAQREPAILQVGKDGISDALVETIGDALKARELIKVSVLKTAPADIKETAFDLARLSHSEVVQVIGRTVVLYKPAREPKILLP